MQDQFPFLEVGDVDGTPAPGRQGGIEFLLQAE